MNESRCHDCGAASAEFDEFVYTDVAKKMELDDDGAGTLLMAFREWRTKGEKS